MNQICQSIACNGDVARINAHFVEDTLDLTIFANQTAWNIKVSKDELTHQSTNHCSSFEEYYSTLKTYIECHPKDVEFVFDNGTFVISLILKNKMKMLYFSTGLIKVDFIDSIFSLVDSLYSQKVEYYNKFIDIQNQHTSIKTAHDIMDEKLKEFIERKKSDEQKLCNNFIQILNEKKRHILHLNDLLISFKQGRPTVNPPVQVKRKKSDQRMPSGGRNVKTTTPQASSASEGDDDNLDIDNYETDDEQSNNNNVASIEKIVAPKDPKNLSAVPSTSKIKDHLSNPLISDLPTQTYQFPRRIRSNSNVEFEHIISSKKKSASTDEPKKSKIDIGSSNDQHLPTVNFDTQCLLDNIP